MQELAYFSKKSEHKNIQFVKKALTNVVKYSKIKLTKNVRKEYI